MKIETISQETFAQYGSIIEFCENPVNPLFEIKDKEEKEPWRMAIYKVLQKSLPKIEAHINSKESFTTLSGCGIIVVAKPETPNDLHAFLLDKPICLAKGVWHGCITLSDESLYQITENVEVITKFIEFEKPITIDVA